MFLIPSRAVYLLKQILISDNYGKFINFYHLNKEVGIPIASPNLFGRLEQDLDKARELQWIQGFEIGKSHLLYVDDT